MEHYSCSTTGLLHEGNWKLNDCHFFLPWKWNCASVILIIRFFDTVTNLQSTNSWPLKHTLQRRSNFEWGSQQLINLGKIIVWRSDELAQFLLWARHCFFPHALFLQCNRELHNAFFTSCLLIAITSEESWQGPIRNSTFAVVLIDKEKVKIKPRTTLFVAPLLLRIIWCRMWAQRSILRINLLLQMP